MNKNIDFNLIFTEKELFIKSDYISVFQINNHILSYPIRFSPTGSQVEIKVQREFPQEEIEKYFKMPENKSALSTDPKIDNSKFSDDLKILTNIKGEISYSKIWENGNPCSKIERSLPVNLIPNQ